MNDHHLSLIDRRMAAFGSLPIIGGYYLVLGGGKIGTDFVRYAKERSFPFVVIIDIDEKAEASNNSAVVGREGLLRLISDYRESGYTPEKVYFHCMDVRDINEILDEGIPEFIIPAVPAHAVVNMAIDMLGPIASKPLILSLHIDEQDAELNSYFSNILSGIPGDVVVFSSPSDGVIMLSYARTGEICPDNCMGPENYCYSFKREKPETITAYVRKLLHFHRGWVFESCQMKPGIGGIKGEDFKEHMLSMLEYVKAVNEQYDEYSADDRVFFIATTCNCHGIMNLLEVV
ncbi:hypothetical protein [Methanolobus sp. WCC5]|uniref:hypothetical protein n=1 Tax=Methanolobus sp. WCC5 TaxID=3125785 RepID=UPI003247FBD9